MDPVHHITESLQDFFSFKINMQLEMALGPDNLAYMILIEKGQFYMALHLAAIGKKVHLK